MTPVILSLGSNLGSREYYLRAALGALRQYVTLARMSTIHETVPVDSPPGSPPFLNMVVAGFTRLSAPALLEALQTIELQLGRRRSVRNAARTIDIDIILYGAHVRRDQTLTLPHPRYLARDFVMLPLRELSLPWRDPITQRPLR